MAFQPLKQAGDRDCVIVATLNALGVMSDRALTSDQQALYERLEKEGLTEPPPGGIALDNILEAMALLGSWGVQTPEGKIFGASPYRISTERMLSLLASNLRPFVWVYEKADGGDHAVCVAGLDADEIVIANQLNDQTAEYRVNLDWTRAQGRGAWAFSSWGPEGVEAVGEPYEPAPLPEYPPPPEKPMPTDLFNDFRCLQVWQNFDSAEVATFCAEAGLNAVMVKALDGAWWMGTPDASGQRKYSGNPASGEEVGAMRDFFHSVGLRFGVWTNPLFGNDAFLEQQAVMTATAATWADFIALDTEPYDQFWGSNRTPGKAERFVNRVRELATNAPIIWQPDPRPNQIALLRPEEWASVMNAWGGQHYFSVFDELPETEVLNAIDAASKYLPGATLVPTFSLEEATSAELRDATGALKAAGASGFIIYRYGLPGDLGLCKAAVEGWGSAVAPEPMSEPLGVNLTESEAARVYSELTIAFNADQQVRQVLTSPEDKWDLEARQAHMDAIKQRHGLAP